MNLIGLKYKGTQVAYYIICKRKLWLFTKGITMEHLSDRVALGKLLDEQSFKRYREEIVVAEPVRIDFIRKGDGIVVHEVKYSKAIEEAHEWQVKYYIYYLKKKGINVTYGVLHYPRAKEMKKVYLTDEDEEKLLESLDRLDEVTRLVFPPNVVEMPYCKSCAYYDFCFV